MISKHVNPSGLRPLRAACLWSEILLLSELGFYGGGGIGHW